MKVKFNEGLTAKQVASMIESNNIVIINVTGAGQYLDRYTVFYEELSQNKEKVSNG